MGTHGSCCRVAVYSFRSGIPARHPAIRVEHDNCVVPDPFDEEAYTLSASLMCLLLDFPLEELADLHSGRCECLNLAVRGGPSFAAEKLKYADDPTGGAERHPASRIQAGDTCGSSARESAVATDILDPTHSSIGPGPSWETVPERDRSHPQRHIKGR